METPKSLFTQLRNRVGLFPLFITLILIILIFYFSASTRWILTTKRINQTDAFNMTVELDGIYSYIFNQYAVKTKDFEIENPQIPKGSLELEKAFLLVFLIITLMVSLLLKKEKMRDPAKKEEIEEEAKKYLEIEKKDGKIIDYIIPTQAKLKRRQIGEGEKKPDLWLVPIEITTFEGQPEYHMLAFEPYTRHLYEDIKMDKEFKGEDKCSRCGMFYDEKIIPPSEFKTWYEMYGAFTKPK